MQMLYKKMCIKVSMKGGIKLKCVHHTKWVKDRFIRYTIATVLLYLDCWSLVDGQSVLCVWGGCARTCVRVCVCWSGQCATDQDLRNTQHTRFMQITSIALTLYTKIFRLWNQVYSWIWAHLPGHLYAYPSRFNILVFFSLYFICKCRLCKKSQIFNLKQMRTHSLYSYFLLHTLLLGKFWHTRIHYPGNSMYLI